MARKLLQENFAREWFGRDHRRNERCAGTDNASLTIAVSQFVHLFQQTRRCPADQIRSFPISPVGPNSSSVLILRYPKREVFSLYSGAYVELSATVPAKLHALPFVDERLLVADRTLSLMVLSAA
jgi:hypothetical protein